MRRYFGAIVSIVLQQLADAVLLVLRKLGLGGLAAALTMLELKRAVVKRADGSYEGL